MPVRSLGGEDPLEKEMATHSSTLSDLPFGIQGKSWRLETIPCKQETRMLGDASVPRSPTR